MCDTGYLSAAEAERVGMRYDHLVRQRLWDAFRQEPDVSKVCKYFAGEVEGLVSEAERLSRTDTATMSEPTVRYCLKHALSKGCGGPPGCKMVHLCPFCGSKEQGCLIQHIAKAGYGKGGKGGKGSKRGESSRHFSGGSWERDNYRGRGGLKEEFEGERKHSRSRSRRDRSDREKLPD